MSVPLIDVHAHFHTPYTNRADWSRYNQSRLEAGRRIGVRCHVASVLGSWGFTSPTYFASPGDQTRANDWMLAFARESQGEVRAFVAVNPNFAAHALREIDRGFAMGAIGVKLAAGRRADDALIDDIASAAGERQAPVLQHVWQHRRRDWPNQDASDGLDLARIAARHPRTTFLLAHIGGGGDWAHTFPAIVDHSNIVMDLSGSGVDRGMIDAALEWVGAQRVLWASDLTMCTGLSKLWALPHTGASAEDLAAMRWRNAVRIFPPGSFDEALNGDDGGALEVSEPAPATSPRIDVSAWIGDYPFRAVPHPEPAVLANVVLPREGFTGAWVGHLPGAFHRDPAPSNRELSRLLAPHRDVLHPAPIVRPDWPRWERELDRAVEAGAPAVRVYPAQWGLGVGHPGLHALARACGDSGVALHVTVRFEDLRQRHSMDTAGDVSAALLRALARDSEGRCPIVVAGAGRELIEETYWGLTPVESSRLYFDFAWVWGPPDDHFAHLVRTVGAERFAWATYWPLRLAQQSQALVSLLDQAAEGPGPRFSDGASIAHHARRSASGWNAGEP